MTLFFCTRRPNHESEAQQTRSSHLLLLLAVRAGFPKLSPNIMRTSWLKGLVAVGPSMTRARSTRVLVSLTDKGREYVVKNKLT
jgi:hypothetical protein